ncbi:hypothetical protein BX666DRAFT_1970200 [Dichotomocladium elegans]|nr:hypothetical protein BX666DRAFT_1970200 [Dichotomocladium elegans]
MVSSLLHVLPPIAPTRRSSKGYVSVPASTATKATRLSDAYDMIMNEKQRLPFQTIYYRRQSMASSSFRDADPFVHSMQDVRNAASSFATTVAVTQSMKSLLSFLLFKPMVISVEDVRHPIHTDVELCGHISPISQQRQRRRSNVSNLKSCSPRSKHPSHLPPCVPPAIPPRKKTIDQSYQLPAAAEQTRKGWAATRYHTRHKRVNPNELRMLAAEARMIQISKIIRPLRDRRYLAKRLDLFVWGRRSTLRIYDNDAGGHYKQSQML